MPSSAKRQSSIPILIAVYVTIGFALQLAMALYARSVAAPGADPISVMVGPGSFPEKVVLFVKWWLVPALIWPLGLVQVFLFAQTKH